MEELCLFVKTRCDNGAPTREHINKKSWTRCIFCEITALVGGSLASQNEYHHPRTICIEDFCLM